MSNATDQLAAWQAASLAASKGLSYRIGDLMLTRVDADKILENIIFWQRQVDAENARAAGHGGPLSVWGAKFGEPRGYHQDRDW
jgi:hypothetical protein